VIGEFARTGWLPYPPLSELTYSPGVGVDYYLWSLEISGLGTLVAGINLVTTVLKLRTTCACRCFAGPRSRQTC
jgi:cytochrome o ubiquinol oxidase subunit 1